MKYTILAQIMAIPPWGLLGSGTIGWIGLGIQLVGLMTLIYLLASGKFYRV